jgi:hypothetical protein
MAPADPPGIVYLIYSPTFDAYKIGMTECWDRRSKQLKVGTATKFVMTARVIRHRMVERELHRRFSAHRLPQTEWFKFTDEQVTQVINTFRRLEAEADSSKGQSSPKSEYTQDLELKEETYILQLAEYFRRRDNVDGVNRPLENYASIASTRYQASRDRTESLIKSKYQRKDSNHVFLGPFLIILALVFAGFLGQQINSPVPQPAPTSQYEHLLK